MTMKVGKSEVSFSWSNYTRATPKNLLRFSELIQGILLGISTGSMFTGAPYWVPIALNVSVVVVNRLVMFFGSIVEETQSSETAEMPSGKTVTITSGESSEQR